ncbi:MAG: hypothetical protein WC516_08505 [Patescibacteria group bacterium]|jgi:hypothetical protein
MVNNNSYVGVTNGWLSKFMIVVGGILIIAGAIGCNLNLQYSLYVVSVGAVAFIGSGFVGLIFRR